MTAQPDFDRFLESWLADGPSELSDRAASRIVQAIDNSQRGPTWLPRRETMNRFLVAAGSVAAIALIAVIGIGLVSGGGLFGPGATTSPTSSPEPTVAPSPEPTVAPTTEPTATAAPTNTPAGTIVVRQPVDGAPGITVTKPDSGWRYNAKFEALEKGVEVDNLPEATILHWANPPGTGFYVPRDPCSWASTRPDTPATTADEISAALAAQASRDATEPVDVVIGGYEGKSLTIHVPDDAVFADCDDDEFVTYATDDDPGARVQQGPGQIDQLWILDVEGSIVIIDAMYRADTPAEVVEEMRTIAESATFEMP